MREGTIETASRSSAPRMGGAAHARWLVVARAEGRGWGARGAATISSEPPAGPRVCWFRNPEASPALLNGQRCPATSQTLRTQPRAAPPPPGAAALRRDPRPRGACPAPPGRALRPAWPSACTEAEGRPVNYSPLQLPRRPWAKRDRLCATSAFHLTAGPRCASVTPTECHCRNRLLGARRP